MSSPKGKFGNTQPRTPSKQRRSSPRTQEDRHHRAFRLADGLPPWYEGHAVERGGTRHETWVRREGDVWVAKTLEGTGHATDADWCMEGASGEYYPMSEDAFRERYEPAPDGRWRRVSTPLECWPVDTTDPGLMPAWVKDAIGRGLIEVRGAGLTVHASWVDQLAAPGDDVLIHASDEDIYPCKADIFEATYEVLGEIDPAKQT